MSDTEAEATNEETKENKDGDEDAEGLELPTSPTTPRPPTPPMVKPKMDLAKALSIMGFSSSRTLDPSMGHDTKSELANAVARQMVTIDRKKRAGRQLPTHEQKREDVRKVHEAYQFLTKKYQHRMRNHEEDDNACSMSAMIAMMGGEAENAWNFGPSVDEPEPKPELKSNPSVEKRDSLVPKEEEEKEEKEEKPAAPRKVSSDIFRAGSDKKQKKKKKKKKKPTEKSQEEAEGEAGEPTDDVFLEEGGEPPADDEYAALLAEDVEGEEGNRESVASEEIEVGVNLEDMMMDLSWYYKEDESEAGKDADQERLKQELLGSDEDLTRDSF